jgi:hypothetical protein
MNVRAFRKKLSQRKLRFVCEKESHTRRTRDA